MQVGLCKTQSVFPYIEYHICDPSGTYLGVVHVTDYMISFDLTTEKGHFTQVLTYNSQVDYLVYILGALQLLGLDPQFNDPMDQLKADSKDLYLDVYSD